ncbi:hypothetical protein [Klebsiella pneumoniae]|uniref:hypothetical protein n=1 Tax=Klebsiella pneumoniae TaxID=573 RepID=UPI0003F98CAD|nr:hypothetical protein [Klebsiella pneumoniae]EIX9112891.1 hypothetical protein [Klebsiella pneumoniae]EJD3763490.1 hypothetical protein [Klebsiella pneumoniae]MEA4196636.1 hypothetical protein [Klebsiella pneumoniae]PLP24117.1 hypothetical protein CWN01_15915 [Klebsiella pneumoniae]WFB73966.1 hypothetical protein LVO52_08795 [Klebsiella pneumoniae]
MKIFIAVLSALIAFSALSAFAYVVYEQNQQYDAVEKCVDNTVKESIRNGDYNITPENKNSWREQCRQMIEGD